MGPWTHMTTDPVSGDVDFGPDAGMSYEHYNALQLQWFDATLKQIETELSNEPPVRIFVMGGDDGRRSQAGKMRHGGRCGPKKTGLCPARVSPTTTCVKSCAYRRAAHPGSAERVHV